MLFVMIFSLFVSSFINLPIYTSKPVLKNELPQEAQNISVTSTPVPPSISSTTTTTIPKPLPVVKANVPPPVTKPVTPVAPSILPSPPAPPVIPVVPVPLKAKAALPLYIYPSPNEKNWQVAIDAGSQVDFIIANVYNGPSTEVKTNWTNMIQKAVAAGIKVYGYVSTDYSRVNGESVDKDVSLWLKFYPQISGIFFDEVAAKADKIPYYKARYDYVKNINSNLKVVINPGTNTDEGYMNVSDVNILFESSYDSWLAKKVPTWMSEYPKERFYAIVYGVATEAQMKEVVRTAKEKNFGKLFVTSASGPSSPLPSYFQAELAEIAK